MKPGGFRWGVQQRTGKWKGRGYLAHEKKEDPYGWSMVDKGENTRG